MHVDTGLEQLFFSTVPIFTQKTSEPDKFGYGTGFIFYYQNDDLKQRDQVIYFLVTNKHVVNGADIGRIEFFHSSPDAQPLLGQLESVTVSNFAARFHGHPNSDIDIAVMPLHGVLQILKQRNVDVFYRSIPNDLLLTNTEIADLDAVEDIIFIGYPKLLRDPVNLTPVARKGTTATPVVIDYGEEPKFLVDAAVFEGSSGSPVFLAGPPMRFRNNQVQIGSRVRLIGVIAQLISTETQGEIQVSREPDAVAFAASMVHMMNLGIVYKASTVLETIDDFLRTHFNVEPSPDDTVEPVSGE
jgi:hypothetical protein